MLSLKGKKASELTATDCRELIQFFFSATDRGSGTSSNMDVQTAKSGPCLQNISTNLSQIKEDEHESSQTVGCRINSNPPPDTFQMPLPLQWCRSHTGQLRWPSLLSSHQCGTSCSGREGGVSATSYQLCHLPVGYSGYETADPRRYQ